MAWAARTGFTVVRVLAMNRGWMDLSPADGRRALPRTLALAREHGLYVQVVALAGTGTAGVRRRRVPAASRCARSRTLCAAADNCVLELANEPYHSLAGRAGRSRRACAGCSARCLPRCRSRGAPPATIGRTEMAGGSYVVAHVARGGKRWERVGRVQDLGDLSRRTGKFVVDSEPIGAAEAPQPSRRDNEPAAFFAQGLLARMRRGRHDIPLRGLPPGPGARAGAATRAPRPSSPARRWPVGRDADPGRRRRTRMRRLHAPGRLSRTARTLCRRQPHRKASCSCSARPQPPQTDVARRLASRDESCRSGPACTRGAS